jgi:hypothetical protein
LEVGGGEALGGFDHASFRCSDRVAYERLLSARKIPFDVDFIPESGDAQLFFSDPVGNGIELMFDSESS